MSWWPLDPDEREPAAGDDENVVVLVENIADVSFGFFGAADADRNGDPRWRDRWENMPGLPLLVRINVTFPDGDGRIWPELVVAPMITSPAL
jgi:hypothetical protein